MEYIARWGSKGFLCTPTKNVPFQNFSSSKSVKSEEQDSNNKKATNKKGFDLQKMSFETSYYRAAGVDPRAQEEEWKDLVGKSYPLYIGGVRFGPNKMMLKSVDSSNYIFNNSGGMIGVTLSLTMEEDSSAKATAKTISNVITGVDGKLESLSATPSTEEKAEKKILNTTM